VVDLDWESSAFGQFDHGSGDQTPPDSASTPLVVITHRRLPVLLSPLLSYASRTRLRRAVAHLGLITPVTCGAVGLRGE
jgi:hypothetical protein